MKRISEKSLELNVLENLINIIRRNYPQYPGAFLYGFTLRSEHAYGLDASISLPNNNSILGLQFKKPVSFHGNTYRFEINNNFANDQHLKLYFHDLVLTMLLGQKVIFYAFPAFYDTTQLSSSSPNFLPRTFFISPLDMPIKILDSHKHMVEIDINNNTYRTFSKTSKETKKITGGDVFYKEIIENEYFINVKKLKENIKKIELKNIEKKFKSKKLPKIMFKLLERNWSLRLKCMVL